jgi:signal peptidase I, archaeal type
LKKVINISVNIFLVLTILLAILAIYSALANSENPQEAYVLGYKPVIIKTGSMEPTLKTDCLIIIKKAEFDDLKVGDIITYQMDSGEEKKFVTHRIVDKAASSIQTKGDANESIDGYILTEKEIRAKVVAVFNFVADMQHEIFKPNGGIYFSGLFKWIIFPILMIVGLIVLIIFLKRYLKNNKKENDSNLDSDSELKSQPANDQIDIVRPVKANDQIDIVRPVKTNDQMGSIKPMKVNNQIDINKIESYNNSKIDSLYLKPNSELQPDKIEIKDDDKLLDIKGFLHKHKVLSIIMKIFMIVMGVFIALIIAAVIIFKSNPVDAYIFGYKVIPIKTDSMYPTMKKDSMVIGKKIAYNEVNPGDAVSYVANFYEDGQDKRVLLTNRVLEVKEGSFVVIGDNNTKPEEIEVKNDDIRAKAIYSLNWMANLNLFFDDPLNIVKWVVIPVLTIVILLIIILLLIKLRKTKVAVEPENKTLIKDSNDNGHHIKSDVSMLYADNPVMVDSRLDSRNQNKIKNEKIVNEIIKEKSFYNDNVKQNRKNSSVNNFNSKSFDLSNVDISDVDLSNINLDDIDLSDIDINGIDIDNIDITNFNLDDI